MQIFKFLLILIEWQICQILELQKSRMPKDKPYKSEWKQFQFSVRWQSFLQTLQRHTVWESHPKDNWYNISLRKKEKQIYGEVTPEFPMVISFAEKGCCVCVHQYTADKNLAQSFIKTDLTNVERCEKNTVREKFVFATWG